MVTKKIDEDSKPENRGMKLIIEPSRRKSVKKVRIIMEGKLNIYNSPYILSQLKDIVEPYDILDFKLTEIEELDVSVIQTLYYFNYFYVKVGKRISFQIDNPSQELKALLTKTKYQSLLFKRRSKPAV